jgi:hypothetical protein
MDQFDRWMKTVVDRIEQARREFQTKLAEYDRYIDEHRDTCKRFLIDRIETRIRCVLVEQSHKDEINGVEVENAKAELVQAQKLVASLNSQPLIIVSSATENNMNIKIPSLVFPSIRVDGFDWTKDYPIGNTVGAMEYSDQQHINILQRTNDRQIAGKKYYLRFRVEKHSI